MMRFIKTKDEETRDRLLSLNFELIDTRNGVYTFINNASSEIHFDNDSKIVFTNILNM